MIKWTLWIDASTASYKKVNRFETKLDATFEQVASNTEHEVAFNELASIVAEHSMDIRL